MPQPVRRRLAVKFICALALTFMLGVSATAQSKSSRELDGLFGPVHTVVTTSLSLTRTNDIWVEAVRPIVSSISYDESGNDGRIALGLNSPHAAATCVSKKNDAGQEIELDCLDHGRGVKMFFVYDTAGRVVDEWQKDENGKLNWRHTLEFDEQGRRSSVSEFDTDNKLKRRLTWSFNEKGNQIEWTESLRKDDQMILFQKNVWTYDDNGNILTETQYGNPEGTILKQFFSYVFDQQGNWIKRERGSAPVNSPELQTKVVETRVITYYP
jgi:hypothetical protein